MRRASINAELAARKSSISCTDQKDSPADTNNNENALPDLTPESTLALVQPFFPNEWSKVAAEDVTLRKIT